MQEEKKGKTVLYAPSTLKDGKPIPMRILGQKGGVKRQRVSIMAIWDKKLVAKMNGKETENRPESFANIDALSKHFAPKWPYGWRQNLVSKWEGSAHTLKCGAVISSVFEGDERFSNEIRIQWPSPDRSLLTAAQCELLGAIKRGTPFGFVNGANFISLCRAIGIKVSKRAKTDEIKEWGDTCNIDGVCTLVGVPIIGGGRSTVGKQRNYLKENFDAQAALIDAAKSKGIDIAQLVK